MSKEAIVKRRHGLAGVAAIAVFAVPALLLSAYWRGRYADYTRTPEFRAIVGDFLI